MIKSTPLTEEEIEFMKSHCKGTTAVAMGKLLEEKFGGIHLRAQMEFNYRKYGLKSGFTGRFIKGCKSHNKGLKREEYMSPKQIEKCKQTQFKKGHHPQHERPLGATKIHEGRKWIKVEMQKFGWIPYAKYVYENQTGKEVPKEYMLVHINKDSLDDRFENLALIKRNQAFNYSARFKPIENEDEYNKARINVLKLKGEINGK